MDAAAKEFASYKRLAVVGVSRDEKKFGNLIYKELKQRGYQPFAVNPAVPEIGGDKCYPNLATLQGMVDGVIICIPPAKVPAVLQEAASAGLKNIWIQQGAGSPEADKVGQELGLKMVNGKCILMYAEPVGSFHGFHRFINKLVGQY
jgi:uncharacterized protein